MEKILIFFSANKDALTTIGIILTFFVSAVSLYFSARNNKAVHYVNSITKSRIEWIQRVRNLMSDFIPLISVKSNKTFMLEEKELNEYFNNLDKYVTEIKLLLNYSGVLDRKIIYSLEYLSEQSCNLYSYLDLVSQLAEENLSIEEKDSILFNSMTGQIYLYDLISSFGYEIQKSEKFDVLNGIRMKYKIEDMRTKGDISESNDWIVGISSYILKISKDIDEVKNSLIRDVHIYLKSEWIRVKFESKGKTYEKETQEFDIIELEQKYDNPSYKEKILKRFFINIWAKIRRLFNSFEWIVFGVFVFIIILVCLLLK